MKMLKITLLALIGLLPISVKAAEHCTASIYFVETNGRRTASGIPFTDWGLTAAHKTLRFGTLVRVTNKRTGQSVVVKITDRGPYIGGRCIDLSTAAAAKIGLTVRQGITPVIVEPLKEKKNDELLGGRSPDSFLWSCKCIHPYANVSDSIRDFMFTNIEPSGEGDKN